MVIDARDGPGDLIKTNVVESFEACTRDFFDTMIRYQEFLFPTHEDVLPILRMLIVKIRSLCLFREWLPGREMSPMLHVIFLRGTPTLMTCLKRVFGSDYLTLEVRSQSCVLWCQSWPTCKKPHSAFELAFLYLLSSDSHI